jgi:threonine/homoserine/homoserine lactone efflux protein
MMDVTTLFAGFGLSLSLILAIGAQNAFVLRQGLLRQHVLPLVLFCACSDALLINVGVAGFGNLAEALPWFEPVMRYGGAAFLLVYGARAALSAGRGGAAWEGPATPSVEATRRMGDGPTDPALLTALWDGTWQDAFCEEIVLGTAALALETLGEDDPEAKARALWAGRSGAAAA